MYSMYVDRDNITINMSHGNPWILTYPGYLYYRIGIPRIHYMEATDTNNLGEALLVEIFEQNLHYKGVIYARLW